MARPNQLILIANPGSSSRKYALYEGDNLKLRAELHFELEKDTVVCTLDDGKNSRKVITNVTVVSDATSEVETILEHEQLLRSDEALSAIGLRIVAPSAFFMQDHILTDDVVAKLEALEHLAPLHISATLSELKLLRSVFGNQPVIGVSDSAFHRTKPNYAWNYGINIRDADRLDIKRFGYHGLSIGSAVDELWNRGKLPPKVIVCHLGSGSSITGVFHGRSIDTTMGFTPNEGVIMATRSGSISPDATNALRTQLKLDDVGLETYLNSHAGLVGMADSNDIRQLLDREANGDHYAHLALTTFLHTVHKAIGSMLVAMNGCDLLVFTGTIGERSATMRKRIVAHLEFTDFILDGDLNDSCTAPEEFTSIAQATKSKPIIVIPTNEGLEIAKHVQSMTRT